MAFTIMHILWATGLLRKWQDLTENDLHFTFSDTGWQNAHGEKYWAMDSGSCILVYDIRGKFEATELLPLIGSMSNNLLLPSHYLQNAYTCRPDKVRPTQLRHCW
jgi:acetyl-CoA synthetase